MKLRIGTRRSRLALAQAEEIAYHLALLGVEAEIVPMVTAGDRETSSVEPGGLKGLFVGEIIRALQGGRDGSTSPSTRPRISRPTTSTT